MPPKSEKVKGIIIDGARIFYRNFSGKETQYNAAGVRNFCVALDPKNVDGLKVEGWNIKYAKPRDPEDIEQPYIQVKVDYRYVPPSIYLVTKKNKTLLSEKNINLLDFAELENVDVEISPYLWSVGGKSGVKAYLKTMYVTIKEDPFEEKYRDVPNSPGSALSAIEDEDESPF